MTNAQTYPVLELSIDDVCWLDDCDSPEGGTDKCQKIFESLSDHERQALANELGNWLYDGDKWEYCLRLLLDEAAVSKAKDAA